MALSQRKLVVFLTIFFVVTLLAKVYLRSASEYRLASSLQGSGEEKRALARYELALRWYLPFNPYARKSLKAMWEIGMRSEKEGDLALALEAYREVRGAILGGRSLYTPYRRWLLRANERIATIEASMEPLFKRDEGSRPQVSSQTGDLPDSPYALQEKKEGPSFRERKQAALTMLELDRAPSVGWSVVTEIGFVGWVLCAAGLALSFYKRDEGSRPQVSSQTGTSGQSLLSRTKSSPPRDKRCRRALLWGSLLTLFFALWLVGMASA